MFGFTVLDFCQGITGFLAVLSLSGFFAGLYMIPLQSLIQILTTDENRGRFIGLSAMLTMVSFVAGNYLFKFGSNSFGEHAAPRTYLCTQVLQQVLLLPLHFRWVPWFQSTIDEMDKSESDVDSSSMGTVMAEVMIGAVHIVGGNGNRCSQKDLSVPLVIFFWEIAPSKGRWVFALTSEVNNRGLPKAMFWGADLNNLVWCHRCNSLKWGLGVYRGTMRFDE